MYAWRRSASSLAFISLSVQLLLALPASRSNSFGWGVMMIFFGNCCIHALWLERILSASASMTSGQVARRSWAMRAMAVVSFCPNPGPTPSASNISVSTGSLNMVSSASICSTASGTEICMIS